MEGKKRKYSKKKKRNWRKHTDVKDVEEYLEDRRRQEITGIPAAEKQNDQLYFVQSEVQEDNDDSGRSKLRKRSKPLKSEAQLQPNPAIVGFPARKRKRTDSKSKVGNVSQKAVESSSEEEYDKSTTYTQIKKDRESKLATLRRQKPPKPSIQTTAKDLWGNEDAPAPMADIPDDHYLKVTRKKPVKRPNSVKGKPSAMKSVAHPHPGMSYNPTFEDHQDLLRVAVDVEDQRQKAADKLEKKLKLAELSHQQREQVWIDEMTEGILDDDIQSDDVSLHEGEDSDELPPLKRPVRAEDRKPKKQRRKERERKELEHQKEGEKANKMHMSEVYRLRSIKKEIERKEEAISEKQYQRLQMESMSPYETKRLGKHLYEEPDIDIQLSSEVTGSLRNLKPEGNLAMDRFKSLQKRNILEPRKRVRPYRKYKLLVKEKRSARLQE